MTVRWLNYIRMSKIARVECTLYNFSHSVLPCKFRTYRFDGDATRKCFIDNPLSLFFSLPVSLYADLQDRFNP
ncbi:unnamed protein product [Periconia digitata]|uniref:Uncharacterized protein n=1 Tax=Periconia digitata TaxID=1303443 RepID=A0A9W4URJ2_9PLEO|nr:unnamed protein product [Periconia digitata]